MTVKLRRIPIFGEGIYSRSAVVTRQRRLNCYLEVRKDGDRSSIVCYGTPGLRMAFNASTPLNLPMRGMIGTDTALYVVAGNLLKSLTAAGATIASVIIGTSAGSVGLALNPTQLILVDGSAGYIFTPATGVIAPIGGAFPNGARTVAYCNGFFISEAPGTNQFFVSAFNDGTTWNGLSFASAVQAIDGIKAVDTINGLLVIFSAGHLEFWQNVGANPEPFQYIQNSAAMYGIAALDSRVHAAESLLFVARTNGGSFQNSTGAVQIARVRGTAVDIVSNTDIDNILQTMARTSTIADCTAFSYQTDEHLFAQFNFPTANRSLLYDLTADLWSEVQSGITTGYVARHLGDKAASAYNTHYVSDYGNGNVYQFDPTVYTDNGNPIVRELVTRTGVEEFNTFRISQLYLDMETGIGLASPSAQGYNPMVGLSIARDNRDFGPERLIPLGRLGQYTTRIVARRWGKARTAVLKIRMTDPVPFVLTAGAMMGSSRAGASRAQAAQSPGRRRA